jgi:hypothetical protein
MAAFIYGINYSVTLYTVTKLCVFVCVYVCVCVCVCVCVPLCRFIHKSVGLRKIHNIYPEYH